jgi:N-acetylmuramic acid 6-phosphate etherase
MTSLEPHPVTEARHPGTGDLDELSTLEFVRVMNAEDQRVAVAIAGEAEAIARAIDAIAERMQSGGRLIYLGAGTSGRLGVLDAAECPATFGTRPDQVVALMAGGQAAFTGAAEDAEDDEAAGADGLSRLGVETVDSVVGISASGRTPFVLGALAEARRRDALVIGISGTRPSPVEELADVTIAPVVGPEILAGSTRLKAGTAQKMVLNMLSTGVMVRLGKTFGNLMVDVSPTNAKLRERARRIVQEALGVTAGEANRLLRASDGNVKVAILAGITGIAPVDAKDRLHAAGGVIRLALRDTPRERATE